MTLKELEQKRNEIVNGFFWVAFSTIFIFGVPAVLAVYVGKKLNNVLGQGNIQYILLFFAFVLSWMYIAREYNLKSQELRDLKQQILKAREEEENSKK